MVCHLVVLAGVGRVEEAKVWLIGDIDVGGGEGERERSRLGIGVEVGEGDIVEKLVVDGLEGR